MLRFLTSGESHGPALVAILDGMPAGLSVDMEFINAEMARRQKGYGRGARQKIETDTAQILSGVRHGVTTGAPIALLIANRDFENWNHVMSTTPVDERAEDVAAQLAKKAIKRFRPGHADLAGTLKFRQDDIRDVLERASARETAARVAVGALCQQLLTEVRVEIAAHVTQVGEIKSGVDSDGVDLYELDTLTEDS
ncbi:MAG: chorismate synthase, partial [Candidatus Obscuribacterales bacterium]|nr:chorismate synthase [Candidatus Obscuribacterales bacterium]